MGYGGIAGNAGNMTPGQTVQKPSAAQYNMNVFGVPGNSPQALVNAKPVQAPAPTVPQKGAVAQRAAQQAQANKGKPKPKPNPGGFASKPKPAAAKPAAKPKQSSLAAAPAIDWNAVAAQQNMNVNSQPAVYRDPGGGSATSAAPVVYQPPSAIAPPVVQAPQVVTETANAVTDSPTGQMFEKFGHTGTFGDFQRLRSARGPMNNGSVTPEMLRRAAMVRLSGA